MITNVVSEGMKTALKYTSLNLRIGFNMIISEDVRLKAILLSLLKTEQKCYST